MSELTWDDLALDVASKLPRLADGDTISLRSGPLYTQLQQAPGGLAVEAVSNEYLPDDRWLTPEQEYQLRWLGWLTPVQAQGGNWWFQAHAPLSGQDAYRIAGMMIASLRDVYGVQNPGDVRLKVFNAFADAQP